MANGYEFIHILMKNNGVLSTSNNYSYLLFKYEIKK